MFKVNAETCIGCGKCIADCFVNDIKFIDQKAHIKNLKCIKCGHCIAVCPVKAIKTDIFNMDEVLEFNAESFQVNPDNLLNFIKYRRTIRQFKDKPVETEKLSKIIEAGRFAPTAANRQDVSFVVVKEQIDALRKMTLERLNEIGQNILNNPTPQNIIYKPYALLWIRMYKNSQDNLATEDKLFFNAPAIVILTAQTDINGALASAYMELTTNALGLGAVYSGFFTRAAKGCNQIKRYLQIEDEKEVVTALAVGYPDVKYYRTVPRKEAHIHWM